MRIIRSLYNFHHHNEECAVTIGNYDGLHKGHQAIVKKLLASAKKKNLTPVVITFEPQPNEFFNPNEIAPRLMRFREKVLALKDLGVEKIVVIRFNKSFSKMSAHDFVERVLVNGLKMKHIIVGDDFKFGCGREGDIALLKKYGEEFDFTTDDIPTVQEESDRVSSTRIRKALKQNDLALVETMLGRPFGMSGRVAHGDKRGRIIGFPTANIYLHRRAVPISGVYAVQVYGIEKKRVYGVANVGTRPTFDSTRSLLEVHLFDFDRTIYGEHLHVEFVKKLREEKKYDDFEALKAQIFKDAEVALSFFRDRGG